MVTVACRNCNDFVLIIACPALLDEYQPASLQFHDWGMDGQQSGCLVGGSIVFVGHVGLPAGRALAKGLKPQLVGDCPFCFLISLPFLVPDLKLSP